MLPDEEFRSRLRQDLGTQSAPPLGSLTSDALTYGRKLRTRQRNVRVLGGTAAVAAIAVGSVTVSGAFGSNATSAASGPDKTTAVATAPTTTTAKGNDKLPIPAAWTVAPEVKITDGSYVTSQAIVAEVQKQFAAGSTSTFSGDYAYGGGDPRDRWAVTGKMNVTAGRGATDLTVVVHAGIDSKKHPLSCAPQQLPSSIAPPIKQSYDEPCGDKQFADGTRVKLLHNFLGEGGVTIQIQRPDGLTIQVTARKSAVLTDDQLFAIAADPQLNVKMDKTLVANAESLQGDFMAVPTTT